MNARSILLVGFAALGSACASPDLEIPYVPNQPVTLSTPEGDAILGRASLAFEQFTQIGGAVVDPPEVAVFRFSPVPPQPAETDSVVNVVQVQRASFAALVAGEAVDASEGVDPYGAQRLGYGAGHDLEAYVWRWPRTMQITPLVDGNVRVTIEVGPALSFDDVSPDSPELEGDELVSRGRLGVGCMVDSATRRLIQGPPQGALVGRYPTCTSGAGMRPA